MNDAAARTGPASCKGRVLVLGDSANYSINTKTAPTTYPFVCHLIGRFNTSSLSPRPGVSHIHLAKFSTTISTHVLFTPPLLSLFPFTSTPSFPHAPSPTFLLNNSILFLPPYSHIPLSLLSFITFSCPFSSLRFLFLPILSHPIPPLPSLPYPIVPPFPSPIPSPPQPSPVPSRACSPSRS